MSTPLPLRFPFRVRRHEGGVEILPHPEAWRSHRDPSPIIFLIVAAAVLLYSPGVRTLAAAGVFASIACVFQFVDWRLRRQNSTALQIGTDRSIGYGRETIHDGRERCRVRIVRRKHFDDADSFGVELVPQHGRPIEMPYPYFDYLQAADATMLASELATALDTTLVRGTILPVRSPARAVRRGVRPSTA